jgi:uncharacterized protein (TIGR02246 family)
VTLEETVAAGRAALEARDADACAAFWDEDIVVFEPREAEPVLGRTAFRERIASICARYERIRLETEFEHVREDGDAGVVRGIGSFVGTRADGSEERLRTRALLTFRRRDGRWLEATRHISRVP